MNRYASSFFITFFIYSTLILGLFYLIKPEDKIHKILHKEKIYFHIYKAKKEKIVDIKPIKKVIKKKTIKQKPQIAQQTIKKSIAKKMVKVERKEAPLHSKKEIVQVKEKQISKPIVNIEKPIQKEILAFDIKHEKENYYKLIHETIEKHKHYPKLAQKRSITDCVKISFTLSKEGKLLSYKILQGKKIFHNSVIEALEQSFPLKPKNEIFTTNLTINMEIHYTLI